MFDFGSPGKNLYSNYKPLTKSCRQSRQPSIDSSRLSQHPSAFSAVFDRSGPVAAPKKPLLLRERADFEAIPRQPTEMITAEVVRTLFLAVVDEVKKVFRNFKKCKIAAFNCEATGTDLLRQLFQVFFPVLLGSSVTAVRFATRSKTGEGWDSKIETRYSKILCTLV